ncbi:hypothetical protein [Cohnella sp. GCM10012308]|uniref:head-tail joining protein n=1 Tax=Cohnella sp. GCM10012308 TaxID=3317329 RepID=UPI0036222D1B
MTLPLPNFKDFVAADNATFLNPAEFGDLLLINDREIVGVLDQSGDTEHPWASAEGVSVLTHVLFVSLADFGGEPEQNEWLKINGRRYRVDRVYADMGVLTIGLEANVT